MTLLQERMDTTDGLQALTQLFPPDILPPKQTQWCPRCEKEYDPQIPADNLCRKEHPLDRVREMWDTSKKSWNECEDCGKTFGLNGFHSWGRRRRDDPQEEGDYCFEYGRHQEEEVNGDGKQHTKKPRAT